MHFDDIYAAQHYTDPNQEEFGRSERKKEIQNFLEVSEVAFNCWCLSEALQEYYCVYSNLNFVSVELTSLVFYQ